MDLTLDAGDARYNEQNLAELLKELGYGVAHREHYYDKNQKVVSETIKCGNFAAKYPFCITSNLTLGTVGVIMAGQGQEKVLLAESKTTFNDLVANGTEMSFLFNYMIELQRTFDKAQASANRSN